MDQQEVNLVDRQEEALVDLLEVNKWVAFPQLHPEPSLPPTFLVEIPSPLLDNNSFSNKDKHIYQK